MSRSRTRPDTDSHWSAAHHALLVHVAARLVARYDAQHRTEIDELVNHLWLTQLRHRRPEEFSGCFRVLWAVGREYLLRQRTGLSLYLRRHHADLRVRSRPPDWFTRFPGPETDSVAMGDAARYALSCLPPDQRAAVIDRYWHGLTDRQIAARVRACRQTVNERIQAGLAAARAALTAAE